MVGSLPDPRRTGAARCLVATAAKSACDRRQLLTSFDSLRRELDGNGQFAGADAATERALNVLTSSKLLDALDLSQEPEKVRARYGDGKPYNFQYDGAPTVNDQLLAARYEKFRSMGRWLDPVDSPSSVPSR